MKKLILAALFLVAGTAQAQTNPIQATDILRFEASRLDQAVAMSTLGAQARNATYNLARQADVLYRCVTTTTACSAQAMQTQNSFQIAESILFNTQQTAPNVHYQFLRTRQAHQTAQIAVQSAPTGMLRAAGYMNRVQFNFQGRGVAAILNSCLNWGQAYGILQVRELYVNGRIIQLGGIVNIRQACQYVGNYAIPGFQIH